MNTTEKLAAIRAKCVGLLEIASRRTQGEWYCIDDDIDSVDVAARTDGRLVCSPFGDTLGEKVDNAAFFASCAGPAEAGWRATIAAIDMLTLVRFDSEPGLMDDLTESIITAWEGII